MHVLQRRREAAQAVVRAFIDKPFEWGQADCGRLMGAALRALGHSARLSRLGSYKSRLGVAKALKRLGTPTPQAYMDALGFAPISPASALPGDIIGCKGADDDNWAALTMAVGNGRVLGFHEAAGRCCIVQPIDPDYYVCAWRIDPKATGKS